MEDEVCKENHLIGRGVSVDADNREEGPSEASFAAMTAEFLVRMPGHALDVCRGILLLCYYHMLESTTTLIVRPKLYPEPNP